MGERVSRLMVFSVVLGVSWSFLEAGFAMILQGFLVAIGLVPRENSLLPVWYPADLPSCLAFLAVAGLAKALLVVLKSYARTAASNMFLYQQRKRFFRHAMANAASESTQKISSFLSDTVSKSGGFASAAVTGLASTVTAVLVLVLCFGVAPRHTLLALVISAVALIPFQWLARKVGTLGQEAKKSSHQAWQVILQSFRNYFFLRLTGTTTGAVKEVDRELLAYYRLNQSYSLLAALRAGLPHALGVLVVVAVSILEHGSPDFRPAVLLSFVYLFTRFAGLLSEVNASSVSMRFLWPNFREMLERYRHGFPDAEPADTASGVARSGETQLSIRLEDVWYRYPSSERYVLEALSLEFREGEALMLKGESGVGKSTLVAILLGVLRPTRGRVLLNGREVPDMLPELSRLVGYVGPEPYMVTGTVRENLMYGLPPEETSCLTDDDLYAALTTARAADFVNAFPRRLDEHMHEHVQLSTGQRQRLSIARALLRKPRVLVLDEATANLDRATELALIKDFESLLKQGVGLLIVTHRDSFDDLATKKVLMERSVLVMVDEKQVH